MTLLDQYIKDTTPVYITTGRLPKKGLFRRNNEQDRIYRKEFNPSEFVGEEICLNRGIRTVHYFLWGQGFHNLKSSIPYSEACPNYCYEVMLGSKSFYRPGFEYKTISEYGISQYQPDVLERMLDQANGEENREQLLDDMLQMLALDIFMGQTDRYAFNYEFEEDKHHNIRLAPLFDFEYSLRPHFVNENDVCYGDLAQLRSIENCKEFIKRYPEFRDLLASYLDESLISNVRCAYAKRGMQVSDKNIEAFQDFEKKQKAKIKKIVL